MKFQCLYDGCITKLGENIPNILEERHMHSNQRLSMHGTQLTNDSIIDQT